MREKEGKEQREGGRGTQTVISHIFPVSPPAKSAIVK